VRWSSKSCHYDDEIADFLRGKSLIPDCGKRLGCNETETNPRGPAG
jgi:hypothetical protein